MTAGRLISPRFPYLPIRVTIGGQHMDVEALLDTGFDGDVILPPRLIDGGVPPDGHMRWTLADDSTVLTPYYLGTVRIGTMGSFNLVISTLGNEPLVGLGLAINFTITLDHGRQVIVEP